MKKKLCILSCILCIPLIVTACNEDTNTESISTESQVAEFLTVEESENIDIDDETVVEERIEPMPLGFIEETDAYALVDGAKIDIDSTWEDFKNIMDNNGWVLDEKNYPTETSNFTGGGEVTTGTGKFVINFMANADSTGSEISSIHVTSKDMSTENVSVCGANSDTSIEELREKVFLLEEDDTKIVFSLDKYIELTLGKSQTQNDGYITLVRNDYEYREKYAYPDNYDDRKYSWRQTSTYRDIYGNYHGYVSAGKNFMGQTFDEIWQMMEDPSCDFDTERFWKYQFFGNCTKEDIKFLADNGYDFLDLTTKIAEAGYTDAVLYFNSIGHPMSSENMVVDNINNDTGLTEEDVLVIYPDINGESYITIGDAADFEPLYDKERGKEAFAEANKRRVENGLQELVWDEELYRAAEIRATELATNFSHTRPDGTEWKTVSSVVNGENIAEGYAKASSVVQAWMDSQGHRENILRSEFTRGAIAIYEVNGQEYWCQLFGA